MAQMTGILTLTSETGAEFLTQSFGLSYQAVLGYFRSESEDEPPLCAYLYAFQIKETNKWELKKKKKKNR